MALQLPVRLLNTERDCLDFVRGCTFLATGGGGSPERGAELLLGKIDAGNPAGWVDPGDIPGDVYTVSVFGMGGRPPAGHPTAQELSDVGLREPRGVNTMVEAVKALAEYASVEIGAIVPIELGGSNTAAPMVAAASLGMVVPDGDYTGRAIPEITQIVPSIAGAPAAPFATVDRWGDVCILTQVTGDAMAERIGKLLSQAAFGGVSMAGFLMPARQMRDVLVAGTLSRCLEIGRAVHQAREKHADPVAALVDVVGGALLFRGVVEANELDDSEGYRYGIGTHRIRDDEGRTCSIWYKNENHICWIDGHAIVTSPDLICIVEATNGEPKINSDIVEGQDVSVIGVPASSIYRSPAGIERLGPRHFGFDIDYQPLAIGGR